jgi:glycosyltransferase involved in cell wall biosynthesis
MVCYSSETGVMRILLLHNWYRHTGGEDNVVRTEMSMLSRHGHDVALLDADNRDIGGVLSQARTAGAVAHSPIVHRELRIELRRVRPDIVHVHNLFPILTPAALYATFEAGVPVVYTLHNFRLLCGGATLMRDGRPCELCVTGSPFQAVRYRCYRDSRAASAAAAWMIAFNRRAGTFQRKVDRFIALTQFAKSRFVHAGYPPERIAVKPDAISDPAGSSARGRSAAGVSPRPGQRALFLGRLSPEKGVSTLLGAWTRDIPVDLAIAGVGPLAPLVGAAAEGSGGRIDALGFVSADRLHGELAAAQFLVMPSECYEGFGVVIIEAFAHGTPVLASNLGSMAELVEDGVTGLLFDPGDQRDLAAKATWLAEHPQERQRMGAAARREFERKYTLERNYDQLMTIYAAALEHAGRRAVA